MTVACERVTALRPVVDYLRRDILANYSLILDLETPGAEVPREVWVARREDYRLVGAMVVEDYSGVVPAQGVCVCVRAEAPDVVGALLRQLRAGEVYCFAMRHDLRGALLAEVEEPAGVEVETFLALAGEDLRLYDNPGEITPLTLAERELTARFPDNGQSGPPLGRWVEWADNNPDTQVVFGLLVGGEIVSFVQFQWLLDDIWEVGSLRTRDDQRRKGYARALLSHAASQVLAQGLIPFDQKNVDNVPAVRTALAVGFHEVFRLYSCKAQLKART